MSLCSSSVYCGSRAAAGCASPPAGLLVLLPPLLSPLYIAAGAAAADMFVLCVLRRRRRSCAVHRGRRGPPLQRAAHHPPDPHSCLSLRAPAGCRGGGCCVSGVWNPLTAWTFPCLQALTPCNTIPFVHGAGPRPSRYPHVPLSLSSSFCCCCGSWRCCSTCVSALRSLAAFTPRSRPRTPYRPSNGRLGLAVARSADQGARTGSTSVCQHVM